MKKVFFLAIMSMIFIGCKAKDEYFYLSEKAKEYIPYKEGETFYLKDNITDQMVPFKIVSIESEMKQGSKSTAPLIYFGPSGDDFYEWCTVQLTSTTNCLKIALVFFVSEYTESGNNGVDKLLFEFNAYMKNCNDDVNFYYSSDISFDENLSKFDGAIGFTGFSKGKKYSSIAISKLGIIYLRMGEQYYHREDYIIPQ